MFLLLRWSHHSKDLQQWTNITAHLLLKILLSRHQIVYSRERASRPPRNGLNSAWILFFIFSVSYPLLEPDEFCLWKIGLMPTIDQGVQFNLAFPGGSEVRSFCYAVRRLRFDPSVGKMPWRREGLHLLQYSGLENPMDCILHGSPKNRTDLVTFTSLLYIIQEVKQQFADNLHFVN